MKKFLAVYVGTAAAQERSGWAKMDEGTRKKKEAAGMQAWMKWGETHQRAVVENGGPLGKTKRVGPDGISDIKNNMAGFTIVEAESHEAAAKLFEKHPHFTIFPGDSVEVMECLPIPGMPS
jgi:hypothetical protein